MAPVRVTVKSRLPEFHGLNLNQAPIEPDITWAAFFQVHLQIDFNPNIHGIKSTRNIAFAQDTIQQTSDLFQRSAILVNIIRVDQTIPPSPRIRRRNGHSSRSDSRRRARRSGIRANRIPSVEIPIPMPSASRGQRNDVGGIPQPRGSPLNGHRRPRNPLQLFPEDLLNGEEDPNGPDEFDHLVYAESMASQDSQETEIIGNHNPNFSALKRRVLTEIGKVPNADFDQMLREMRNLANGDQKYRWSRKAPMVGNMMFQAFQV